MSIVPPVVSQDPSGKSGEPRDFTAPPAAIPAPDAAMVNATYKAQFFNPWFRVKATSQDTGKEYDLSPDILSIDTKKALSDPAGEWSLTLNPRRIPFGRRNVTWADLIGEQDYVEITMGIAHFDPGVVVMRGFVDHCHRIDAVDGQRGLPARRVLISGRDFGKLWLDFKVFYLVEASQNAGEATNLMLIYWGIEPGLKSPDQFLGDVYNKLLAPKLGFLRRTSRAVPIPTVACEVPARFQISTFNTGFMTYTGSLWNVMQMYVSPPFTEFFIRDVPGASVPEIRWRWAPLCKLGNRLALPWTPHPPVHTVHADLLQRYDVDQSDNQRFTYFWAPPGQYGSPSTGLATGKLGAPGYIDGPGIDKYGYKDYQPDFQMYTLAPGTDPANDDKTKSQEYWIPQIKTNVQWLADTMLPNDKFLEGTLQTHLRPDLCMGDYVDVPEEGTRFYLEAIGHSITVTTQGVTATTAASVSRGQRLGDRDVPTPDSYKYVAGTEIPGGSLSGAEPTPEGAAAADAAQAGGANGPGSTTPQAPAPPFIGEAQASAVIRLLQSTVGVVDYALGRRNIDKGSNTRETFASMARPGPYNAAGDQGGGVDCSELVEWGLRFGAGIKLPTPAQNQYNMTPRVPYEQLQAGDVVFFGGTTGGDISGANITHSGFYIGDGQMINAQDFKQKVKVADLSSGYWRQHFVSGGRVFTPPAPGGAGNVPNQH